MVNTRSTLRLAKRKHEEEAEEEDRLSSLSDELLHVIMAFLSLQDAVRTCVLSRRWKLLWRLLPDLDFNLGTYSFRHARNDYSTQQQYVAAKLRAFNDFITQLLVRRRSTNSVSVWFTSSNYLVNPSLVESLLCYAIEHNVQELDIVACCRQCIQFPSYFTRCESLKTLILESVYRNSDDGDFCTYNINNLLFPALQTLELIRFKVRDPVSFYSGILSSSPNLQDLKFVDSCFHGVKCLRIRAPNLKSLEFEYSYGDHFYYSRDFKVVLDTPNLTTFTFDGYDNPIWCLACCNLSSLDQVYFDSLCDNFTKEEQILGLVNTVKMFSHAKSLTIPSQAIKALSVLPALVEESQLQFPNLKYLELIVEKDKQCDFLIHPSLLYSFLSNFPSLKIHFR